MESVYLHWAKNRPPARFNLASSEVEHYRLDQLPFSIADLELDGASYDRYLPLRQAIAAKSKVGSDCVVLANGTSMANFLAMAALIKPGDEVVIERPTYEPLIAAASFLGATIKRFDRLAVSGYRLDPKSLRSALTERTSLVILTNLHNPTGVYAGPEELRLIGEAALGVGARVLIDEVYLDAAFSENPRSAFHLGDHFIGTSSLTKVYGLSGIRCGWILAAPDLAERMWRLNDLFGVAQPHAAERLGCIALEHLNEIAAPAIALLERNRGLVNNFLASRGDLECRPIHHGITAFPRLLSGKADDLHALLIEKYDTAIVPGRFFELPDHFRIGIGTPSEMLEAGLERLGRALDELR